MEDRKTLVAAQEVGVPYDKVLEWIDGVARKASHPFMELGTVPPSMQMKFIQSVRPAGAASPGGRPPRPRDKRPGKGAQEKQKDVMELRRRALNEKKKAVKGQQVCYKYNLGNCEEAATHGQESQLRKHICAGCLKGHPLYECPEQGTSSD